MRRFSRITTLAVLLLLSESTMALDAENTNSVELPNVVLINADDLGYGDLSCYGAKLVETPNIDALASGGMQFTDAHSPSAVCSPSRYGLLTGRYPLRNNYWGPIPAKSALTIDTDTPTIASVLSSVGYDTAVVGKWHLGFGENQADFNKKLSPGPLELGFDYNFLMPGVNSGPPFVYVENSHVVGYVPKDPFVWGKASTTKRLPEKGGYKVIGGAEDAHALYDDFAVGETLCEKSVDWIKGRKEKPFFLYLATTNIHHPFTPAKRFQGTSKCGAYGDFIHELDWIVGEVVKTAEQKSKESNRQTLIIFTSDNGGMLNNTASKAWEKGHRMNGDLLGFKFGVWEGGHRVPFIVKWEGKVKAGSKNSHLMSQIDLLNTFASIVGAKQLKDTDSINQHSAWLGAADKPLRKELVIHSNSAHHLSIRTNRWLYIPAQGSGGFSSPKWGNHLCGGIGALKHTKQQTSDVVDGKLKDDAPSAQLFDLSTDPRQTKNVILEQKTVAESLRKRVKHFWGEIPDQAKLGWIAPGNDKPIEKK